MRLICALSIVFVLGATSTPAGADDVYKPVHLPACKMHKTITGKDVCGYENLEDWKVVLVVDAELTTARNQLKNERERIEDLVRQRELLTGQIEKYADTQLVLTRRNEKLTQDLIALDKKYQDERVKPRWGSPVAWTIAAVSTAVLAGFVINAAID